MNQIYSRAELVELSGWKQKSKIRKWLTENGIRFYPARDGWPSVPRGAEVFSPKTLKHSAPNRSALMELQNANTRKNSR